MAKMRVKRGITQNNNRLAVGMEAYWAHSSAARHCFVFLSTAFATSVSQAADAVAGKRLYPVCTACHGAAGQGNRGMGGPKLAGQQGIYLLKQLQNFQSGARGMSPGDAKGRQMAAMSKGPALSSAVALENLVAYLETLPDKPSTPTLVGDVAGENLYAACVSCHGEMAQGLETMAAPRLAGQNDWYLVGQLQNFATASAGMHQATIAVARCER